jgi:LCP family protein required for cell wall assembly
MSAEPTPASAAPTPSKPKRSWPQRLTIGAVFALALGSFSAAGGLYAGQRVIESRNLAPTIIDPSQVTTVAPAVDNTTDVLAGPASTPDTVPVETFPPAEPGAQNFLITGADNNSCVDPNSPYAGAFGDRSSFGERSDTIMMWRVNPDTSQVAVLSFPRDLYVNIAGSSSKGRINTAYERDKPQKLIDTIYQNFGVNTDHFVQVDFCAFKKLVDSVGSVSVPFATPIRDKNTGLQVDSPGCYAFTGDSALAYVRSRHLEYQDANGEWKRDGTSDLGRISRQQDFIRRTVTRLLAKGAFDPSVANGLITTLTQYVVTDDAMTTRKMLELAGVMSRVDPAAIATYQIEGTGKTIQGNSVLVPSIKGSNMQAILAVFRGEAALADIPVQVFDTTAPTGPDMPTTTSPPTSPGSTMPPTATTLPSVVADQNVYGVVPDKNTTC